MENKMKYYINRNKEIFGFEADGSQDYLIKHDMIPISLEEIEAINKAKEDEIKQSIEYKVQEAKSYLTSTDYKMTVDYFATLTKEEQDDLIKLRAEARQFLRDTEI